MTRQWWDKTVTVGTGKPGQSLVINSTERAAKFLLLEWPGDPEEAICIAAKIALIDAFEGLISTDEAREAFIAAALEAGILVFEQ